jgi:ketosteroid isomerase-like protein
MTKSLSTPIDQEKRLQLLEDESALRRLAYEYCHGLDKRNVERFLDVWHDDARWISGPLFGNFIGKEEIRRGLVETMWPAFKQLHHWTTNFVVDIDGDRAYGLSDMYFAAPRADGVALLVSATYNDTFERRDGRWRIAERVIDIHYFSPLPGVEMSPPASAMAGA